MFHMDAKNVSAARANYSVKVGDRCGDKGIMDSAIHTPDMREGAVKICVRMADDEEFPRPILRGRTFHLTWAVEAYTSARGNLPTYKEIPVATVSRGISLKRIFAVLSIALFLTVAQGHAMSAFAESLEPAPAKPAETGKPKGAAPVMETVPRETAAAGKAGGEAGKTVAAGVSTGTIGKGVALAAGILAIAIAASGGGGGGGGNTTTPAHH